MSTVVANRSRLLALIGSSWRSQAIHAMVVLGIADALGASDATPLHELAQAVAADADALRRLLRGLRALGLVREGAAGYALTPMGQLLRSGDAGQSLAQWVRWWAGDLQWRTWGALADAVRAGQPMRERFAPAAGYELHAASATAARIFHSAMTQLSAPVGPALVECLAPTPACRLVDVGGGRGELLGQMLQVLPQATGVLLEQEHAIPMAREHLSQMGVLRRCTLVPGDFFRAVPGGGDLYLLKSVLHNWADGAAESVLRRCRQAMATGATLAVVERAIDDQAPQEADIRADLNMLVALGGRERTLDDLHSLFGRCGLRAGKVVAVGEHRIFVCRALA